MVPRQDVDCVFVEDGYDEAMKVIRSKVHTRYPLCVEDIGPHYWPCSHLKI